MRLFALLVAVFVLATASAGATGDVPDRDRQGARTSTTSAERQPASEEDRQATLGYLADCDVQGLSPAGTRAYRLLERLVADGLSVDESEEAFDARGVLMAEAFCWPDGYPDLNLGDDIRYPPES